MCSFAIVYGRISKFPCCVISKVVLLHKIGEVEKWNAYSIAYSLTNTHSLTHCCAWPAEGRSDLHNERSRVANWQALMGRPMSSSTCWSQVLCGRPGGRLQSAAGGVPVKASKDRCSACETGVSLGYRQMWPKVSWCYISAFLVRNHCPTIK